jgi:hypothetical protein
MTKKNNHLLAEIGNCLIECQLKKLSEQSESESGLDTPFPSLVEQAEVRIRQAEDSGNKTLAKKHEAILKSVKDIVK